MRIVGGSMFGELSGKAGGLVAARNRAGQYLRQYVVPTDPRSVAQINARARFGQASSDYHSMTPTQKASWQEYATVRFNTPFNPDSGVYSGFNAFVSLQNVVLNHNDANFSSVAIVPVGATPGTPSFAPYTFDYGPQPDTFIANITNGSDVIANPPSILLPPVNIGVAPVSLITNFTIPLSVPTSNDTLENQNSTFFGIAVYMSNSVEQPGMFVQNPYLHLLGSTGSVTVDQSGSMTALTFTVEPNPSRLADFGRLPSTSDIVQISVMAVSEWGELRLLGSGFAQV